MVSKRSMVTFILLTFFALLVGSSVMADDGRINRAPYHFGGDTLFCDQEHGCKLLDINGHELASWSQDAVATALSNADKANEKRMVDGEGKGTYGPMQLWALPGHTDDGNSTMCMVGFDEWGKQNDMCFEVTKDWHFEQAPLPVSVDICANLQVGEFVWLISNHAVSGTITSIDGSAGTVTFGRNPVVFYTRRPNNARPSSYTAPCDAVEQGQRVA